MKYADLKTFVNSLTDAELQQDVKVSGENGGGVVESVTVLAEDYWNPSGEGCEPVSAYDEDKGTPNYPDDEPVVWHKGDVMMFLK